MRKFRSLRNKKDQTIRYFIFFLTLTWLREGFSPLSLPPPRWSLYTYSIGAAVNTTDLITETLHVRSESWFTSLGLISDNHLFIVKIWSFRPVYTWRTLTSVK